MSDKLNDNVTNKKKLSFIWNDLYDTGPWKTKYKILSLVVGKSGI